MKKTEELRNKLGTEENDLKALGIGKCLIREERNERFEDTWLPKLKEKVNVIANVPAGKYTFTLEAYGIIDFYPKANKLLIRKSNKWRKPALQWIINVLHLHS